MKCVRTNGVCASTTYPNAPGPSETALVPFAPQDQPQWVVIDANNPLPDVNGKVPNPGVYVLVATYKQNNPGIQHKQIFYKFRSRKPHFCFICRSDTQHEYYPWHSESRSM